VADDQFAVLPAAFASAYFKGVAAGSNPSHHYPIPTAHTNCQWPEGQMTCRLLDSGARLVLAPFSFRINHWRFVHGEGPPFSRPSPTPGTCPCTHCH